MFDTDFDPRHMSLEVDKLIRRNVAFILNDLDEDTYVLQGDDTVP